MDLEYPNLIIAFFAGLFSFVSPCVLPLVPAYIGYLSGRASRNIALETGMKSDTVAISRFAMLLHGFAFVLGFTTIFVAISIVSALFFSILGGAIGIFETIIGRLGGSLIIFFGLHYMGAVRKVFGRIRENAEKISLTTSLLIAFVLSIYVIWAFADLIVAIPVLAAVNLSLFLGGAYSRPQGFWVRLLNTLDNALYQDTRPEMEVRGASGLLGSFSMGIVFAAGWTPCIGPLLGSIVTLASQGGNVPNAMLALTAYSLGLGLPFMATAWLMEGAQAVLRRLKKHMRKIELVGGSMLVLVGIMVATGTLQILSQSLSSQTALAIRIEECGLGFVEGELDFEEASACFNGNLSILSLGQSVILNLTAESPEHNYRLRIDEPMTIDVEFGGVRELFAAEVILYDEAGQELARSNSFTLIDENKYLLMQAIQLDAGKYTVSVRYLGTDETTGFRFRVRRSEAVETDSSMIPESADSALELGKLAPDFEANSVDGEAVKLSDLRGQVVLINFWGTWCSPCLREMPELQEVYEAYRERGFVILALATGGDTAADVTGFRDDYQISFLLIVDSDDVIKEQYAVTTTPSSFIVNREGVIVFQHFGAVVASQISEILDELLAS